MAEVEEQVLAEVAVAAMAEQVLVPERISE